MTITEQIRRAYGTYSSQYGQGCWMMIAEVASRTDLTISQIHDGIRDLLRTDPRFYLIPESNQKALTQDERAAEIVYGNQRKHLISWQQT